MKGNSSNLILAVILIIGFMFFWDGMISSRYRPQTANGVIPQEQRPVQPEQKKIDLPIPMRPPAEMTLRKTIETGSARIKVESQGARISSWQLNESDGWIELISQDENLRTYPLQTFPEINFSIETPTRNEIVFVGDHPYGFRVTKKITLLKNPPFHEVSLSFKNLNNSPIGIETSLGWGEGLYKTHVGDEQAEKHEKAVQAETKAVAYAQKLKTWKSGFFSKTRDSLEPGPYHWAGIDNDHFLTALIFENQMVPEVRVQYEKNHGPSISVPIKFTLGPSETKTETYRLFVGPKKYRELMSIGYELDKSLDFGFISKTLVFLLNFFHERTHNYGWAIILLTIFIQILLFPLTRKSLQSSLKMKAVQPQVAKIREQFKDDPKRQQIEMFNIYKKNGLKFMGMEGCLPMIVQMPIFFAIFKVLRVAYELRGAEWILWVKDLSGPDPIYVLPIIMGAMMFLQQKLTAAAADPQQAKMMMFFPVMMTIVFLNMPAGLILYWTVQSVSTIVIQKCLKAPTPQPA